jgi:hypothetical protein
MRFVAEQAELEHLAGRTEKGLELLGIEAPAADAFGDPLSAAYLAIKRGALLRAIGDGLAEDVLRDALDTAQAIGSPALELQAATELAVLLDSRGQSEQAAKVLEPVYNWFTEGFNTAALVGAKQVLERVSRH